MQLHQLKPNNKREVKKRIGRGGKRGKTSGRGGKGQTARAGNSTRPEMRDFIKKLPKLRGHGVNRARTVNSSKVKPTVVNLARLEAIFGVGEVVSPKSLVAKGVINSVRKSVPKVKILGNGELSKSLQFEGCEIGVAALAKIEKAGGKVIK